MENRTKTLIKHALFQLNNRRVKCWCSCFSYTEIAANSDYVHWYNETTVSHMKVKACTPFSLSIIIIKTLALMTKTQQFLPQLLKYFFFSTQIIGCYSCARHLKWLLQTRHPTSKWTVQQFHWIRDTAWFKFYKTTLFKQYFDMSLLWIGSAAIKKKNYCYVL